MRSPLGSAGFLAGGTVAAAVLGLGFQSLLAYLFGAGAETDAFFMSVSIFAFLAKFLMFGHLKSLTLPRVRALPADPGRELLGGMMRMLALLLGLAVLGLVLASPWVVRILAPGYDPATSSLTATLLRIRLPALFLVGITTVGVVAFEARGRFGRSVVALRVLPAGGALAVLGLAALGGRGVAIEVAAWAGLVGAGLGALWVVVMAWRTVRAGRLLAVSRDASVRGIGRAWLRLSGSNLISFLAEAVYRVAASLLPAGLFSAVLYGRMVHDLAHGAVNDSAQSVALPALTDAAGEGETALGAALRERLTSLVLLVLPLAATLAVVSPWLIAALFGRGRFVTSGLAGAAAASLALFCIGLVVQGGVQLLFAACFAAGISERVNRSQAIGHLARALALVPLVQAYSYVGLVLAQVGMNVLVLVVTVMGVPRAWGLRGPSARAMRGDLMRGLVATAVACLVTLLALREFAAPTGPAPELVPAALATLAGGTLCLGGSVLLARVLGLGWLWTRVGLAFGDRSSRSA